MNESDKVDHYVNLLRQLLNDTPNRSNVAEILVLQNAIQKLAQELLNNDVKEALSRDSSIWLLCHYSIFQHYKCLLQGCTSFPVLRKNIRRNYEKCLKSATKFYQLFIQTLIKQFDLFIDVSWLHERFLKQLRLRTDPEIYSSLFEETDKEHVLNCVYRCLICLGDTARYFVMCSHKDSTFRQALRSYFMAHLLFPENGYHKNQMAILYTYQNNDLETLYWLACSSSSFVPMSGAQSNLTKKLSSMQKKLKQMQKVNFSRIVALLFLLCRSNFAALQQSIYESAAFCHIKQNENFTSRELFMFTTLVVCLHHLKFFPWDGFITRYLKWLISESINVFDMVLKEVAPLKFVKIVAPALYAALRYVSSLGVMDTFLDKSTFHSLFSRISKLVKLFDTGLELISLTREDSRLRVWYFTTIIPKSNCRLPNSKQIPLTDFSHLRYYRPSLTLLLKYNEH
ncbi:telomerase regulator Est1 [Schizosaccharomyces japonicus yFS275]|uniref:Telomerase regulator Est1 n=1 Tax=Schizosaccharomyces japonicus (strain yFS275 / FY16936) TaxID=402676 RepID=B6JX13_SCHJY|nr:telomerase regulator Est1 [Schizosaccharomyces japonicus yFS275]EEB05914.2 telomerase regulator Est1 [Schizosaccharomyces japonicus yFS275]